MHTETWLGNLKERPSPPLEKLRTDVRIILKCLPKKQDGMALSCFFCLRIRTICERDNEFLVL